MKNLSKALLVACMALPVLAGCKKEEAAPVAEAAPLTAPTTTEIGPWRDYVSDVVTRNMEGINNQPFVYLLSAQDAADEAAYGRLLEKAKGDVQRGIIKGNMLAYASPESARMADIIVDSFSTVAPDTMKGVRVLFIGQQADDARVQAAVAPAGVEYRFVDAM
jgi:hypothetical protein